MKVWVAELDMQRPGFSGSWLTVHGSRESARRAIGGRVHIHGFEDLFEQAVRQDLQTSSDVASSTLVKDGDRTLTWVINLNTVENPEEME